MKSVILAIGIILSANVAHAAPVNWQDQLVQYKQSLKQDTTVGVWARYFLDGSTAGVTCATDAGLTAAIFIAETSPAVNGAVQVLASYPNFDQDLSNIFTWAAVTNTTRGSVGGGVVAITDTMQFLYMWLAGDTSQSYQELKQTYASTIATAESLFANQGECMMSIAKTMLTANELQARHVTAPTSADVRGYMSLH